MYSFTDPLPRTSAFPVAWMPGPMLDVSLEADTLERSTGRSRMSQTEP